VTFLLNAAPEKAWLGVITFLFLFAVVATWVTLNLPVNPPPAVRIPTSAQVQRDLAPAPDNGYVPRCETTITGYVICR
jgi:hypothetical protein